MKGLEALKVIYNLEDLQGGRDEFWKAYRIIEKELKALKIIKEKELNIFFVKRCNLEDFNYQCRYDQQLSKEEYKLLKEVLK